jgi:cobyrinic acid a,c-diamide synthase
MPVCDIAFENGIFFSREVGCVDASDAKMWTEALMRYAKASQVPIIILVDARQATTISTEARRIFAFAAETPNVRIAAVATNNLLVTQQSRIAALMGTVRHTHETHFFKTFEEAEQFASSYIAPLAYSR